MNVEMVDIYFSIPRDLLSTLGRSEESKRLFHRFMDDILLRISSMQNSKNIKKILFHSPSMITNTDCAICLEPIKLYSTINILPCCHGFHTECVKDLTNSHHYNCPVCRASI
jgi:hypothetical protein